MLFARQTKSRRGGRAGGEGEEDRPRAGEEAGLEVRQRKRGKGGEARR